MVPSQPDRRDWQVPVKGEKAKKKAEKAKKLGVEAHNGATSTPLSIFVHDDDIVAVNLQRLSIRHAAGTEHSRAPTPPQNG